MPDTTHAEASSLGFVILSTSYEDRNPLTVCVIMDCPPSVLEIIRRAMLVPGTYGDVLLAVLVSRFVMVGFHSNDGSESFQTAFLLGCSSSRHQF